MVAGSSLIGDTRLEPSPLEIFVDAVARNRARCSSSRNFMLTASRRRLSSSPDGSSRGGADSSVTALASSPSMMVTSLASPAGSSNGDKVTAVGSATAVEDSWPFRAAWRTSGGRAGLGGEGFGVVVVAVMMAVVGVVLGVSMGGATRAAAVKAEADDDEGVSKDEGTAVVVVAVAEHALETARSTAGDGREDSWSILQLPCSPHAGRAWPSL